MKSGNRAKFVYLGPFDPVRCEGVSASMFDLLAWLSQVGHSTSVFGFKPDTPWACEYVSQLRDRRGREPADEAGGISYTEDGVRVVLSVVPGYCHKGRSVHRTAFACMKSLLATAADSIVFTVDADFSGVMAACLARVQGAHIFHSPGYVGYTAASPVFRFLLRRKRLFGVSAFAANEIRKCIGRDSEVWPPFIGFDRVRTGLTWRPTRVLGYYSGGPHKGEEIVARLTERLPGFEFVAMGVPLSDPRAEGRVRHLGRTCQPRDLYASVSVMLVPSIAGEGFPRVALEAMANGIPVVASRIGGLPEAVEDAGILLDVDADRAKMAEGFAQAIERLFSHEAEFQDLSMRSLCRVERYDRFQKEQAKEHAEMLMRESTDALRLAPESFKSRIAEAQ